MLSTATPVAGEDRFAIVEATKLYLRQTPAIDGRAVAVLTRGTRVKIVERSPGWLRVAANGKIGYLRDRNQYVRPLTSKDSGSGKTPARIATIQRKAATIERQIARHQAEVVEITEQERDTIVDLDTIDEHLNQTRSSLAGLQEQLRSLRQHLDETGRAIAALESEARQVQALAARRLTALYKLHWLGRVQILAGGETVNDLLARENALGHILAADEATLKRFSDQRQRLETLMAARAEQYRHQAVLEAEVEARVKTAARERERRREILSAIQDRKALALASLQALEEAASRLDETIGRLNRKPTPAGKAAVSRDTPFHACKGLLKMPVNGKVLNLFGPYRNPRFNVINVRGGIDIRAEKGEPIRAVHGGRVLYAKWFKGYGNMIIIDHGDAYYTVYAHAEEMFKQDGTPVEAGEVIATVGDTGSLEGAMLYFEVRHHGKPEDPLGWLQTS